MLNKITFDHNKRLITLFTVFLIRVPSSFFPTIGHLGEGGGGVGLSVDTPAASDSHLNADEQLLTFDHPIVPL